MPQMPDRLVLHPPPPRPESDGAASAVLNVVPMLGSLGSIVLVSGMGGENRARGLVAAGMILFATVGFVVVQVDRQRTQRARRAVGSRTDYLLHLDRARVAARAAARHQRAVLTQRHPDPGALPALAGERGGLWPRDVADPTSLLVRYGACPRPAALELVPPDEDAADASGRDGPVDPAAAAALARLLAVHRVAPDLPATVDLRTFARVEVCGETDAARSLTRALVCSAASGHAPDRLQVAVLCGRAALPQWDWVKWLPHGRSTRAWDAVGPSRMVATDPDHLRALLDEDTGARTHLLLVVDGIEAPDDARGVTVLDLPETWEPLEQPGRLRLELTGRREPGERREVVLALRAGEAVGAALADRCSPATAEAFARRLAPLPAGARPAVAAGPRSPVPDAADVLGLGDPRTLVPAERWGDRPATERLRVPIGVADDGSVVHLDLKEAAHHGMGPHGLLIGATGSGKSELLRTLVLGLALAHAPDQLAMVLVDFKGGATFAGLADLPHVSAMITNLEAELALVDRMQDALRGEIVRRQEALRAAGQASVRDYEEARAAGATDADGAALDPLPSLFVVVDEFSEMLAAQPELIDLFVAIGRLGRSLGLHLLLASQRLDEGRLRGLESHLSYRIGLRTFSAGESRTVLGVPDAATLPSTPGVGYLRPDPATLTRFRAAYASGRPRQDVAAPQGPSAYADILPYSVAAVPARGSAAESPVPGAPGHDRGVAGRRGPNVLDLAVGRLAGSAPPTRRIWLPPLEAPDTLGTLMPDLTEDPALGLVSPGWRDRGPFVVPVGVVDHPLAQRREALTLDLREAGGHLAVVGAPRSGKSTVLASTVAGLALTTTPLETRVLALDLGGGVLSSLAGLPHVAGVATRAEPDVVRRVVAEAASVLEGRERGEGDDGWGDVFLVVDGWATVRGEFEELDAALEGLAVRGLTYGVHLLVAATRWSDLRPSVRDAFGTRLELRLGDPLDSEVDRRAAALVPPGRPGRGLTRSAQHFLGAVPRLRPAPGNGAPGEGTTDLVRRCARAWRGPAGPGLRLLPERITLEEVRREATRRDLPADQLLLGVDERQLAPVALDTDREPHLLVLGERASGKTAALRAYAHEVMRSRTPAEAQLVVVDYRRSLLGEVPDDYLLDHLTSATAASPALGELAAHLEDRLPGPGVEPRQLRERSWWTGPDLFVLVDDYDLVATVRDSPVVALEHLMPQARDVGLHVVVARRSGGASRSMHEPVLQSLRDLAMPGLLLSGDPGEGRLIGTLAPRPAGPGRARLLTRDRGVQALQLAWHPDSAGDGPGPKLLRGEGNLDEMPRQPDGHETLAP